MKNKFVIIATCIVILLIVFCIFGLKYFGNMPQVEIQRIVERDSIIFDSNEVNDAVLGKLADYKVVIVGEYHNTAEHVALMGNFATALNRDYGFNNFLIEMPQAFSWMYEDYSMGLIPEVDEKTAYNFWFHTNEIKKIRQYNMTRPLEERIKISTIDINHSPYAYIMSIEYMLNYIGESHHLKEYSTDLRSIVKNNEEYIIRVVMFKEELSSNKEKFIDEFGEIWYDRLVYMTDIEIESYASRTASNYLFMWKSDKLREAVICSIAELYIKNSEGKVLINVGGNHAQKKPIRGTRIQWLGEYLSHESPYAKDQTYCMLVIPAEGSIEGGNGKPVTLFDGSRKNELFSIIAEYAGGFQVFLSFDDDTLKEEKALMNFHYDTQSLPPKHIYDGVIILPIGTYVNPFPDT